MMKNPNRFLFLVLSCCIIVPFSNDVYMSALPIIGNVFHTAHPQFVLSIFLFGTAISQLFYGPLSDRFGRKPILVTGLVIYVLASVLILFSYSFAIVLIARFLQAVGACSAIISTFAILRDVYPKEKLIQATGIVMAIIGVCPAIAPLLGSFLTKFEGWKGSFIFLLLLGIFFLFVILFLFRESQEKKNMCALKLNPLINNYKSLTLNKTYMTYCTTSAFSYGILFSYFALSPLFIITQFGYSIIQYGILVAINAIAILSTALIAPKIVKKIGLNKVMMVGIIIIILGGISMAIMDSIYNHLIAFLVPMFIITLGIGMIRPTASAGAMSVIPHKIAGSAAAGFNFLSFVGSTISTVIATLLIHTRAEFGVLVVIFGISACLINFLTHFMTTKLVKINI